MFISIFLCAAAAEETGAVSDLLFFSLPVSLYVYACMYTWLHSNAICSSVLFHYTVTGYTSLLPNPPAHVATHKCACENNGNGQIGIPYLPIWNGWTMNRWIWVLWTTNLACMQASYENVNHQCLVLKLRPAGKPLCQELGCESSKSHCNNSVFIHHGQSTIRGC